MFFVKELRRCENRRNTESQGGGLGERYRSKEHDGESGLRGKEKIAPEKKRYFYP